jgi:hypothetical protein
MHDSRHGSSVQIDDLALINPITASNHTTMQLLAHIHPSQPHPWQKQQPEGVGERAGEGGRRRGRKEMILNLHA